MVRSPRELQQAITICRSEARAAFGDDSLYLEQWLEENRHVEVQVIVDRYGNGVHVGERDCSVQRRHQKIVEEAPSPALDDDSRLALARECDPRRRRGRLREPGHARVPASTTTGNYYFIEINCRIQVEHPVTEMLSGMDLVVEQIRIAAGEPLGYTQADVHAARPRHRVPHQRRGREPRLPAAGRARGGVTSRRVARACAWTAHLYSGYEVPPYYDSLLGKLIVWGPDRTTAIDRARVALDELVVDGLTTNVDFHRALLDNATFLDGDFTTNLLDRVGSAAFLAAAR